MAKTTVSEFIISFIELIEIQTEEIKLSYVNSGQGLILYFFTALLFFITIIFLLLGIKIWVELNYGEVIAYFSMAFITLILSLIALRVTLWKMKKKR